MNFTCEMRFFILKDKICTFSTYEGYGNIHGGEAFLKEFISKNHHLLPITCVLDVGIINNKDYAIIEANPVWGSGLNGCDAFETAKCILNSTTN